MKKLILLTSLILSTVACNEDVIAVDNTSNSEEQQEDVNGLKQEEGVLKFSSLDLFLEATKEAKEIGEENYYNTNIEPLLDDDYKPLRPYFSDDESYENYIREKYPDSLNIEDIELDDSIIIDPAFQVLLNEDRQVIVGNKMYTYEINGVYITEISNNDEIRSARVSSVQGAKNSNTTFVEMDYTNDISHDHSQENNSETRVSATNSSSSNVLDFNTSKNFGYKKAGSGGLLGKTLGFSTTTYVYTPNSRRVKVKYWDRNWIFFSSIGSEVRFQKKKKVWRWTFWQKSYPTKVALGFNHITYKVTTPNTFDWDAYNKTSGATNYGSTFIYDDKMYNSSGRLLNSSAKGFNFPIRKALNSDNAPLQIYYMWKNKREKLIDIDFFEEAESLINDQVNSQFNSALNKLKSIGVNEETPIKMFDFTQNSMQYTTSNIRRTQNRDNAIVNYIDFGILVSVKLTGNNFSSFNLGSKSLNLTEVKSFDAYGAALYNGVWYGKRIIGYNK